MEVRLWYRCDKEVIRRKYIVIDIDNLCKFYWKYIERKCESVPIWYSWKVSVFVVWIIRYYQNSFLFREISCNIYIYMLKSDYHYA
jgi:hypothetical protein